MNIEQFNFAGKKAFVRVDFNVPLDAEFNITDDTRIRAALPTLKKILADGGSLIIGSHLGRPKKVEDKFSLRHILAHVSKCLGVEVQFADDCVGADAVAKAAALKGGEALLLENLRFYAEEEGKPRGLAEDASDEEKAAAKKAIKESQKEFTKKLAALADCYVNDAFGTAHRAHASTALIAEYFDKDNKMFGYLMGKEVDAVNKVMQDIKRPFTAKAKANGVNLVLSTDSKIADAFSNDANTKYASNDNIPDGWIGMDIGPDSIKAYSEVIKSSKTILWNGPTGVFEMDNFADGSRAVAAAIADATAAGAFSLVGGGDSVACVNKFGYADKVSYVSTGGGALLEAIEGKKLPGIAAIEG